MSNEEIKFVCHECSQWVTPYEYNIRFCEAWFVNGDMMCEMGVRCPHCGHSNIVNLKVNQATVLEVIK